MRPNFGSQQVKPVLIRVLSAFIVLICLLPAGWAQTAYAQDAVQVIAARAAGDDTRTRFVVDLERAVEFAAFTLADPYRVVIDVPEFDFTKLGPNSGQGRGLVGTFRFGLIAKGKSRIVLDLSAPATIDEAFVLQAVEDQPARLVLDLVPTNRTAFLDNVGKLKSLGTLPVAPPQVATPPSPSGSGRMVVVLDPGHGGIDDGAIGPAGTKEKDLVLAFAKDVEQALKSTGKFDVYLTRRNDTFISLDDRVAMARARGARLMISIHADIVEQAYVRGATIYTLSENASDEAAEALAEKENRSDAIAGVELEGKSDEVADILIDLARRETKNISLAFSRTLLGKIDDTMRLNKNPQRSAGFKVLTAPDVPSVLVELGYLSNAADEQLLLSESWREKAAARFALAVEAFFRKSGG